MSQHTNLLLPSFETEHDEEVERKTEKQTLNGGGSVWRFKGNRAAKEAASVSIKSVLSRLYDNCSKDVKKTLLPLGHGDPSVYPCFKTSVDAEEAVAESLRSGAANSYAPGVGILPARRAVANYLNRDLPHELKSDDIFMTVGCCQGIETIIHVLSCPKSNILLPSLIYPLYYSHAIYSQVEIRKYDLLPDQDWEIDLQGIEVIADDNTIAMVIANPHNPCGNVYTYQHLKKVAEMAKKLGIMVISDEVYKHTIYGENSFVPMGIFASIVPVVTLGSVSKGWLVPGWRIGWMAMHDPNNVFKTTGVVESIKDLLNISPDPSTILQVALPNILEKTKKDFFDKKNLTFRQNVDMMFDALKEVPCLVCPKKPESCAYLVTKLDLSLLEDITDDVDFCMKLAREENLVLLPGEALGKKNWVRISIGVERSMLEDAFARLKSFVARHVKSQTT
ncbi:PREDICTED: S-alkyl-thiohydroximate lyase SUR1-like isoform X1 [Brassica oleracea var. oleracea]|uniref:Aminotransferase class I/classII large domain-containing protein n=1 Tax=Brassica oleracea var. oleracea TaxID=109376 RepID=A0A0D3DGL2_BRAOL|nr:PREDICTED: S-alkyl-thiohydroximate lyase SUR1-like isoform X1 [Brassica oleracea var. oleracea]